MKACLMMSDCVFFHSTRADYILQDVNNKFWHWTMSTHPPPIKLGNQDGLFQKWSDIYLIGFCNWICSRAQPTLSEYISNIQSQWSHFSPPSSSLRRFRSNTKLNCRSKVNYREINNLGWSAAKCWLSLPKVLFSK